MSGLERLGRYDIVGQLGRGSFGVVYHGQDPLMKKDVAIKVCTLEDPSLRQRFVREAEISRRLEHENIVSVQAFAEEEGIPYLVQEFLKGEDLREVIRRSEPWSVEQRLDILIQVARGLAYAHTRGIIHRDIKPSNIRVLPDLRAKIMDFGIAKLANDESQLTQKGVTMGTASYLPPEQVRGGEISHRADIFSFGVLAYELLSYQRPFRGKTISALVYQILYKSPDPLATVWPTCPPPLSELLSRCLEKDAGKRCPDMETVVGILMDVRQGVLDGRWPGVIAPSSPPTGFRSEDEPSTSGSILSQSLIARTAKDVTQEVSSAQVEAARATRPVQAHPADTQRLAPQQLADVAATMDTAVTQRVRLDTASAAAEGAAPSGAEGTAEMPTVVSSSTKPEELETSAEEISKLVAAGDLKAAMSQLEDTIQRREQTAGQPTLPPPPPPVPQENHPDLPTIKLDHARPAPPAAEPDAGKKRTPTPTPPATKKVPVKAQASGSGIPKAWIAGGIGALLLLAAGLGIWLGGRDAEPEPAAETVETPVAAEPIAVPESPDGGVTVLASPWAEVLEITDAEGLVQALPEPAITPLFIPLEAGQFRVTLRFSGEADNPDDLDRICEIEISEGGSATCNEVLGELSTQDFFKDNGWWP